MRTVSVRALQRGLAILEYFNKHDGATVTEIMEVLKAPHATTYRLLKTLGWRISPSRRTHRNPRMPPPARS